MLASAGDDVRIWTGDKYDNVVKRYESNSPKITSLAWNCTNSHLASTSPTSCSINVVNVEANCELTVYPILDETVCLSWHSSSRYLGLGCRDGSVRIFDLKTQKIKKTYSGHQSQVNKVVYNYNDSLLASGCSSGEIVLHNTVTETTSKLMTALKLQAIQGLEYSHYHHSMLASVSDDASLVLWDTSARRSVHQFARSHKAPATDLSFSPSNDKLLMSCGLDKRIVLYDVLNKSLVRTIQVDSPLSSICMHTNGVQIASGTITGQILLHDLRLGSQLQHSFTAHRSSVQCLAFHNRIATKKSRASLETGSRISNEADVKLHQGEKTPLSVIDLNAVKSELVANKQQELNDESKPDEGKPTPSQNSVLLNGVKERNVSSTSVFSPDLPVQTPRLAVSSRMKSQTNPSLSNAATGGSIFSPDVQNASTDFLPPRPAYANSTPSIQVTHEVKQHGTSATLSPSGLLITPVRKEPQTQEKKQEQIKPVIETRSPVALHPGNLHSSGSEVVDGNNLDMGKIVQRIKDETKQQLKSELVSEIKDMLESMKDEIKQSVMDHHYEMIKQFFLMQVHVETQTSQHSLNHELLRENQELRAEIERLKRTY